MQRTKQSAKQARREEYAAKLRQHLKPGQTVHTVLRHVSASGMSRRISLIAIDDKGETFDISGWAAHVLDMRRNDRDGGIVAQGCGMDMGLHLVYSLSRALWPDGHGCTGEKCPSNDHINGDRDYTPHASDEERTGADGALCACHRTHWHTDGGYALNQRWI